MKNLNKISGCSSIAQSRASSSSSSVSSRFPIHQKSVWYNLRNFCKDRFDIESEFHTSFHIENFPSFFIFQEIFFSEFISRMFCNWNRWNAIQSCWQSELLEIHISRMAVKVLGAWNIWNEHKKKDIKLQLCKHYASAFGRAVDVKIVSNIEKKTLFGAIKSALTRTSRRALFHLEQKF